MRAYKALPGGARNDAGPMQYLIPGWTIRPQTSRFRPPLIKKDDAMTTFSSTPVVTTMQVIPVAGHDSMLMNLSGAHAPYFTRNIVIIKDNAGHTGVGENPGR